MAGIFLEGKTAVVPVDGEEAVKDAKIIDAIYDHLLYKVFYHIIKI